MSNENLRYGFGKNWEDYIKKHFSEERVDVSRRHILEFLGLENLNGKSFLDIGCGSGLHSLAAFRAGAEKIFGFDYDMNSVQATKLVQKFAGNPGNWQAIQGSILDDDFIRTVEPADIVYSWGVLHHTGNMWKAMDNTAKLAKKGALLYIALYDYEIQVNPTPEFWLDVKKRYNLTSNFGRRRTELWYVWKFMLAGNVLNIPHLIARSIGYKNERGMAIYNDIKDWLGGWPMEFAKRADVKAWADRNQLEMLTMKTGQANTEYLFRKL
ncbi:MAG: class I SAM-dependent methyltransferase [Chloroflexi bacterium]|nr:class I SAM-dependent methyltransferase [Chloroflexota bacterium]